jgi:hypothetical protein
VAPSAGGLVEVADARGGATAVGGIGVAGAAVGDAGG